jgi:glyceraldehyde 3-phosphate dehydrogenase
MPSESHLINWQESQELAESMLPLLGKLYRNKGVEILIYGRPLQNAAAIDIQKAHRAVKRHEGRVLPLTETFPILQMISELPISTAQIDIGRLAVRYWAEYQDSTGIEAFLRTELAPALNTTDKAEPRDVVLYGFGRIGRLLARLLVDKTGESNLLRLRAIVVRGGPDDIEKRASLLRRDSVHGQFNGTIDIDKENNAIIANGTYIKVLYSNGPDQVDYTAHGIKNALVVDNTGIWRDTDGLGLHLKSPGAVKVLLTAPGKGAIKNIVYGVNHTDILPEDNIVSAASCTTNAITPVLKTIQDEYGIINGHVETVHSYTNDQNLIDNFHKGDRRGRGAAMNMVLTSTGAASAVAKALPELKGKLTGNAIRVPTPNVSMAIINLNLEKEVEKESLNSYLQEMSLSSSLHNQIDFSTSKELVSTDMVGSRFSGIVDALATIAEGNRAILYVWYDNEFGYSCQVLRVMQKMAGINMREFS